MAECKHDKNHNATVVINYLEDRDRFLADVRIACECGQPFQFVGLPLGLDLGGASMSADGQEARLAIAPVGAVPDPLEKHALSGFRIRGPGASPKEAEPDLVEALRKAENGDALQVLANYRAIRREALKNG